MFEITTEPARKLVRLKLTGIIGREDVSEFYRQEHIAIRAMGVTPGEHLCIVDVTEMPTQLQDGVQAWQATMGSHTRAKRLALYTGIALTRIQVRRITSARDDVAVFESREEAEAWLFGGVARAAA